jgi:hypothetical protein
MANKTVERMEWEITNTLEFSNLRIFLIEKKSLILFPDNLQVTRFLERIKSSSVFSNDLSPGISGFSSKSKHV